MQERTVYKEFKKAWGEIPKPSVSLYKNWYKEHREYCNELAKEHNLELQQVCGIFSSLSPLKSVEENKKLCKNFLKGRKGGHFSLQIKKAEKIKYTTDVNKIQEILKGDKTVAFFRHLYNPEDDNYCVIDRHMLKLANKGKEMYITPKRYKIISESVKKLSKEVGLKVSETQSCLWYLAKDKYGINV